MMIWGVFGVLFFFYGDNHTKQFPKHIWVCTTYSTIYVHTSELLPDTERNRSEVSTALGAWSAAEALCFYYPSLSTDHSSVPFTLLFHTLACSCQNWFSLSITLFFRFSSRSEKHLHYFHLSVHCLLWIKMSTEVLKYQEKACCHNEFDLKPFEVINEHWFPVIAFGLWIYPWLSPSTRSISIKKFSKGFSDGITSLIFWIMFSEDSNKHVNTSKLSVTPQAEI